MALSTQPVGAGCRPECTAAAARRVRQGGGSSAAAATAAPRAPLSAAAGGSAFAIAGLCGCVASVEALHAQPAVVPRRAGAVNRHCSGAGVHCTDRHIAHQLRSRRRRHRALLVGAGCCMTWHARGDGGVHRRWRGRRTRDLPRGAQREAACRAAIVVAVWRNRARVSARRRNRHRRRAAAACAPSARKAASVSGIIATRAPKLRVGAAAAAAAAADALAGRHRSSSSIAAATLLVIAVAAAAVAAAAMCARRLAVSAARQRTTSSRDAGTASHARLSGSRSQAARGAVGGARGGGFWHTAARGGGRLVCSLRVRAGAAHGVVSHRGSHARVVLHSGEARHVLLCVAQCRMLRCSVAGRVMRCIALRCMLRCAVPGGTIHCGVPSSVPSSDRSRGRACMHGYISQQVCRLACRPGTGATGIAGRRGRAPTAAGFRIAAVGLRNVAAVVGNAVGAPAVAAAALGAAVGAAVGALATTANRTVHRLRQHSVRVDGKRGMQGRAEASRAQQCLGGLGEKKASHATVLSPEVPHTQPPHARALKTPTAATARARHRCRCSHRRCPLAAAPARTAPPPGPLCAPPWPWTAASRAHASAAGARSRVQDRWALCALRARRTLSVGAPGMEAPGVKAPTRRQRALHPAAGRRQKLPRICERVSHAVARRRRPLHKLQQPAQYAAATAAVTGGAAATAADGRAAAAALGCCQAFLRLWLRRLRLRRLQSLLQPFGRDVRSACELTRGQALTICGPQHLLLLLLLQGAPCVKCRLGGRRCCAVPLHIVFKPAGHARNRQASASAAPAFASVVVRNPPVRVVGEAQPHSLEG
eukprot:358611-Chlamydomonas_euryale.AAC.4